MYVNPNDYKFYEDGIYKELVIVCMTSNEDDEEIVISNTLIKDEEFEFNDTIMSADTFTYSGCTSAYIKFTTYYTDPLIGQMLGVYIAIDGDSEHSIPLGMYIVQSDELSRDGKTRSVVAYDMMYDIINNDVTDWYNSLSFPISVKTLRDSFFAEFGIDQEEVSLINDDIMLPRQISEEEQVQGGAIVSCLSELNCVFAHISKEGLIKYIVLDVANIHDRALYPSLYTFPGDDTFPGEGFRGELQEIFKDRYVEDSAIWANYKTYRPDGIQIRNEANEIAYQTNEGAENPYTVMNNIFCYSLSNEQYSTIAGRIWNKMRTLSYVPMTVTAMGNPCLEVGDKVRLWTKDHHEIVTFVFTKRYVGVQVPFEEDSTNGNLFFTQYATGNGYNNAVQKKLRSLDNRVGNLEKSGSGPLQIQSVAELPSSPQLNILYLIQGEVEVN